MADIQLFKEWLTKNTVYSKDVIGDIICRLKRADKILGIIDDCEYYLFLIGQNAEYKQLQPSVKSQIKKSVRLYFNFIGSKGSCL